MCQALTKKGKRCRNKTEPLCYLHEAQIHLQCLEEENNQLVSDYCSIEQKLKTRNNKIKKISKKLSKLSQVKNQNVTMEAELKELKNNTTFTVKMACQLDDLKERKKILEKYEMYDKYINTTVIKFGHTVNKRNTIWDFVNIPHIDAIVKAELGISIDKFEDDYLRLKNKRNKIAHPNVDMTREQLINVLS